MTRSTHFGSDSIQATDDLLTARAGIAPFSQFLTQLGLPEMLADTFKEIRKESSNSASTKDIFASTLCWLMNGDSRHLTSFDHLVKEKGAAALFNVDKIPSSHAMKRFLKSFHHGHEKKFRDHLASLFIRRLEAEAPNLVILGVDSMVMDNDDAECRHGVTPTYKNKKGYHPLQMTWGNMIIDGIFRSGSRASHEYKYTKAMIKRMVRLIRKSQGPSVSIIIRLDAGYFDEKLLKYMDEELNVGFVVGGKLYSGFKGDIGNIPQDEENWGTHLSDQRSWKFTELGFKCKSWDKFYRAVLTQVESRKDGALFLEFARPTSLFLTNLGMRSDLFIEGTHQYQDIDDLIDLYQGRGAEELCHRGLKDFGFEQLPMKGFVPNLIMYHMMLLGFASFEVFKREPLAGVVRATSYPTTVRRQVIDVAGKIVRTGRKLILKLCRQTLIGLKFDQIWGRCFETPPLQLV
jgi:hypothetical protein